MNQDAQITYANAQACRILGYDREEFLSMTLEQLLTRFDKAEWDRRWQRSLSGELVETKDDQQWNRQKNGHLIPVDVSAKTVHHEGGTHGVAFLRDITERKRIERRLRLSQFCFDNASTAIFMTGSDGRIKVANDQTGRYLGYSLKELYTLHIYDISNDLDAANWKPHRDKLGAEHAVFTEALHRWKAGTLVSLRSEQFREPITMLSGEVPPGRYLKMAVSDTGHGLDEETLSCIFEPYFTTKEAGEGTGMGLSTVLGIVKEHSGAIHASRIPGVGTTFQTLFPANDSGIVERTIVDEDMPPATTDSRCGR